MGFFRQFLDSFLDFEAYRGIMFQSRWKTLKYFFLVFFIFFLIGGIPFALDLRTGAQEIVLYVEEEVPEFQLANGRLTVQGPQPIVLDGDGSSAILIDTSGQTDMSVTEEYDEGVFIFGDKVIVKENFRNQEFRFSDFEEVTFDKDRLVNLLPIVKWIMVVIFVFSFFMKMTWVLITTVILAAIGLVISGILKKQLYFGSVWSASIYAFTLPLMVDAVQNQVYPALPYFWMVKWVLAIYILYRGISAVNPVIRDQDHQVI